MQRYLIHLTPKGEAYDASAGVIKLTAHGQPLKLSTGEFLPVLVAVAYTPVWVKEVKHLAAEVHSSF